MNANATGSHDLPLAAMVHALGLHMHQPPGNLRLLIDENEWEAQQIIRCYERVPRYARNLAGAARIHVGFSGVLLEQLRSPDIVDRYRKFVDIPAFLESYREAKNIELIGMGYYHPIFPLVPREDWADQLNYGRQIMADTFGREPKGFWPPEMAFDMEMVPALAKAGYEYVVVDGVHVKATDEKTPLDIYRPYVARRGGASITVIPRDRDISNAQESGLDAGWFIDEVTRRVGPSSARPSAAGPSAARSSSGGSPSAASSSARSSSAGSSRSAPPLVTTWSDGENGGWFRNMAEEASFFGHFFAPYVQRVQSGDSPVHPVLISDYLKHYPPQGEAFVRTGAWNVATTSGCDFSQWAGSETRRRAIEKIFDVSRRYWALRERAEGPRSEWTRALEEVRRIILESETSCFLFWGDAWVPKLYERADRAEQMLRALEGARG